jgi:hypothetical protein
MHVRSAALTFLLFFSKMYVLTHLSLLLIPSFVMRVWFKRLPGTLPSHHAR